MLTERLMQLTIAGGSEWVMVVLLALSVLSLSIIIERSLFFHGQRRRLDALDRELTPAINAADAARLRGVIERAQNAALSAAAGSGSGDTEASEKIVASVIGRERLRLEHRLTFLGTLGNNAPFIGLFGTVLGIIKAFHVLSAKSDMGGSPEVMAGISEALVATAVGLFVAIPAVIAFNYFQKQVDRTLSLTESLAQGVLASFQRRAAGDGPRAARGDGGA